MTCAERGGEEAIQRLMSFADGELDEAEAATLREHVGDCATCRDEVVAIRALDERIRGAFPERRVGASDAAKQAILRAIGDHAAIAPLVAPRHGRVSRIVRRVGAFAAVAAAVLLAVGLGIGFFPDPAAADLAADHKMCLAMANDWVSEPSKMMALISRELGSGAVAIRLDTAGYGPKGALVCEVHGRRFVHLGFVAPGRPPASVYLALAGPRPLFVTAESFVRGESPVVVVRVGGRPGVDCFLVSSPADEPALEALVRDQLAR